MKSVSDNTKFHPTASIPAVIGAGAVLFFAQLSLADQSVEENLAPIAKLCLAGEDCVGTAIGESRADDASAAEAETAAAPVAPVEEEEAAVAATVEAEPAPVVEPVAADAAEDSVAQVAAAVEPAPVVEPAPAAEPVQIAQADDDFDLEGTYRIFCFACHSTGLSGAPLPGDAEAWGPRMEKGRDAIVEIMNRGLNAMPPKGLCMTCTDDQLWELSQYMVNLEQ